MEGQSFSDFAASVQESHAVYQLRLCLQHASLAPSDGVQQTRISNFFPRPGPAAALQPSTTAPQRLTTPALLRSLQEATKAAHTGSYFSNIFLNSQDGVTRRSMIYKLLTLTPATHGVMKFDHCHKPAKFMRMGDGQTKPCIGTAWALNGTSEVLGFYHVRLSGATHRRAAAEQGEASVAYPYQALARIHDLGATLPLLLPLLLLCTACKYLPRCTLMVQCNAIRSSGVINFSLGSAASAAPAQRPLLELGAGRVSSTRMRTCRLCACH